MNVLITCPDVANHVLILLVHMCVTVIRDLKCRMMASPAAVRFLSYEQNTISFKNLTVILKRRHCYALACLHGKDLFHFEISRCYQISHEPTQGLDYYSSIMPNVLSHFYAPNDAGMMCKTLEIERKLS